MSRRGATTRVNLYYFWPPVAVVAIMLVVARLLPERYVLFPVWIVAGLIGLAAVLSTSVFFAEATRHAGAARLLSVALLTFITFIVIVQLVALLMFLASAGHHVRGWALLSSGLYLWAANVLAFGLWYWLVDRGGPRARADGAGSRPELLFPEMSYRE